MMVPNQIKMQSFSSAGRGAYKAAEVDGFMQKVYLSYSELYAENAELKKKFASLRDIIEEYNEGKNAIATALVKAQAVADETVKNAKEQAEATLADAKQEAQKIVDEGKNEADSYADEKKKAADASFENAKAELERIMEKTQKESEEYIAKINNTAKQIIDDANAKAAKLVADAYGDAKKARDKKNEIVETAQKELASAKKELSAFKAGTLELLRSLLPQLEDLSIPELEIESEETNEEEPAVICPVIDEPFTVSQTSQEPEAVAVEPIDEAEDAAAPSADEKADSDSVKTAQIPDADEYIKQIFSDISLPKTDMKDVFSSSEAENDALYVGYNGNKTGFTVSQDTDIFTDSDE